MPTIFLACELEGGYFNEMRTNRIHHVVGSGLCVGTAGLLTVIFRASDLVGSMPFVLLGVVIFVAVKFGSTSGILGSIGAAIVFAEFLFDPVLSLRVSNPAERNNLLWMLLIGIIASELLGAQPRRPQPKGPSAGAATQNSA